MGSIESSSQVAWKSTPVPLPSSHLQVILRSLQCQSFLSSTENEEKWQETWLQSGEETLHPGSLVPFVSLAGRQRSPAFVKRVRVIPGFADKRLQQEYYAEINCISSKQYQPDISADK